MQTILELGAAVAARRRSLGLKQGEVASRAGVPQESLSRFERGKLAEFGSRKLLAVLAALGMVLAQRDVPLATQCLADFLKAFCKAEQASKSPRSSPKA